MCCWADACVLGSTLCKSSLWGFQPEHSAARRRPLQSGAGRRSSAWIQQPGRQTDQSIFSPHTANFLSQAISYLALAVVRLLLNSRAQLLAQLITELSINITFFFLQQKMTALLFISRNCWISHLCRISGGKTDVWGWTTFLLVFNCLLRCVA